MKYTFLAIFLIINTLAFMSCGEEDETSPGFSFNFTDDVVLTSEEGAQTVVSFVSALEWQADVSADWLAVSPSEGQAGANVVTLKALTENDTDRSRTATLTLMSGGVKQVVSVRQETSDYIRLKQTTYQVPPEGGELEIKFSTSISSDKLRVLGNGTWINQDSPSRSLTDYSLVLNIDPNTEVKSRIGYLYFVKEENKEQIILATVTVIQEGNTGSESTDFSEDGEVKVLQEATEGKGIPVILMGDGFIDAEIKDGTYDEVMKKAYENLFTEEPVKSLKEYFDVYAVTAVSKNNIFGYGYETAFSCELEGGGSTLITGDNHAVISYTHCVEDIDYDNALAVVILNSDEYAGTTYFGFADTYNQRMLDFAIAYCPVIESLESEYFRQVLVHEAIGHGFAKLEDEYAYEEQGRIPDSEIEKTRNLQSLYGWAQNVDFTDDAERVLWHEFLKDDRYAGEGLGVFEGACTYVKGAYRATENSMMNDNTIGFNAPSRKAIYDRIMKLGVGKEPAYEAFVEFDLQTDKRPSVYSRTESGKRKRFARPRFVGVGTFCLK